jgi:hypothetical protein
MKIRGVLSAVLFSLVLLGTVSAWAMEQGVNPQAGEKAFSEIGRYQLFQGSYKTFDLKSLEGAISNGIFLLDTKTGNVKRYLNKRDDDGKYIETWVQTETQTDKK